MSRPPRRVLYVEGNIDGTVGGSYFSLLYLATGLDRLRYEPLVVFAVETPLRSRFVDAGVRTMIRPMSAGARWPGTVGRALSIAVNSYRGLVGDPLHLAAILRRERIALVHLNNTVNGNHPWMIAAQIAGIPCVTHERGMNSQFGWKTRALARNLAAIICISAAVRENLVAHGFDDRPLVTIHNGLDPHHMRPTRSASEIRSEFGIDAAMRLVGIVGNIKAWKGQEIVIRAMHLLRDEFRDVCCLLIGHASPNDSGYREHIVALIEKLGLQDRVVVTGYRSDVANYMAALDVQIHASVAPEPFGRVLLEGMALGKPLIASGGGAVPEIVVHGKTGLLFEPGNAESLASCLRAMLTNPPMAAAMGASGRERLLSDFSIVQNVRETQALYDRLLS